MYVSSALPRFEKFKSSEWKVFSIESDHLELVNAERGDFLKRFRGK